MQHAPMSKFLVMTGALLAAHLVQAAPKAVCDQSVYDFGKAGDRMTIRHVFIVKNGGDQPLEIRQVMPEQGCSVSSISKKVVPPLEECRIAAELPLAGRAGAQAKSISVLCNDPEQSNLTLTFKGAVVTGVEIDPEQLDFGKLGANSTVTRTVVVGLYTGTSFSLGKVESSTPYVTVQAEVLEKGQSYRIIATTVPPLPKGVLKGSVHITTDIPDYSSIGLNITGQVTEN